LKLKKELLHLDKLAEEFIRDHGAVLVSLVYMVSQTHCMSPNAQVVHGTQTTPLKSGDVISVDCGAYKNGYHGDHAYSFEIGEVDPETKKIITSYQRILVRGSVNLKLEIV
jgi:methionyl aminopeptidase